MKIKKIGHCCLVIETNGKRIMTDPGSFTIEEQGKERLI
jgi:L-ascorbate metabolism protein UlaG (beta-lactamase superfamily)